MPNEVRFLSADDVARLFNAHMAIESQRVAFAALADGSAVLPDKLMVADPANRSVAFCYAARLAPGSPAVSKFGSLNPANAASGTPSISALIVVLDARTGCPAVIMDGTVITTRRTAAASAVAVSLLSTPGPLDVAVLGSGTQAREHVRMIAELAAVRRVRLWSPTAEHASAAADELRTETGLPVEATPTARDALVDANVVAICTLSREPVISASWLSPGCTVVSIGSIEPDRCEVGEDLVRRAGRIVVDHPETAASHAGPVVRALATGLLTRTDIVGLGDVLTHRSPGRAGLNDVVYFNSIGVGAQDAAAALAVLEAAASEDVGQRVVL